MSMIQRPTAVQRALSWRATARALLVGFVIDFLAIGGTAIGTYLADVHWTSAYWAGAGLLVASTAVKALAALLSRYAAAPVVPGDVSRTNACTGGCQGVG